MITEAQNIKSDLQITGEILGTNLVWCRARFENSSVEVNQSNRLIIEVFSKLTKSIRIASIELYTNQRQLD
jgi:hypothetical protein